MPTLLAALEKQKEGLDDDTLDVAQAAASCLGCMAVCVEDALIPLVLPFIQVNKAIVYCATLFPSSFRSFFFLLNFPRSS